MVAALVLKPSRSFVSLHCLDISASLIFVSTLTLNTPIFLLILQIGFLILSSGVALFIRLVVVEEVLLLWLQRRALGT